MKQILLFICICAYMTACTRPLEEPYRSVFHHTPEANWMNDPNGMFFDDATGLWHLYYQHNPEAPVWGPMHWAHSVSKDLIHWEHLPIAIYPDSLGTIFSGSIVIDRHNTAGFGENAIIAVYTQSETIGQNQSIAYSTDGGLTFTKYESNPVLMGDIADFRDPKVMWDGIQWVMTLACQQEIRFYGSSNLKEWTLLSRFGKELGAHGGVWECPDLIQMDSLWVLLVSINPGGPFGGSATQYFVGEWDGKEFKCENEKTVKWLDYGKDNYSTFTWHNAPDNRIVSMGWMSNWQYAQQVPTGNFRSQNTIARDLSLYRDDAGEYRVRVVPSPESWAIKGKPISKLLDACIVELTLRSEETSVITLTNGNGEKVTMTLDVHSQTFSMDRTASGDCSFSTDFAAVTTVPLFREAKAHTDTYTVHLFIDRCSIEVFDGDGNWAMTNLVFPSAPYDHIHVVGGEATIYDIK